MEEDSKNVGPKSVSNKSRKSQMWIVTERYKGKSYQIFEF